MADEEAPATTANSSPEIVVVDHVSEENGFFVVKGASHTTPDGSLLADEATGRAVAFVAYNMKDMDPTELRAVALPLGDGDDDDGLLGDGAVGRRLILDETRVARAPKARDVFGKVVNYLGIPLSEISGGAAGDAEAAAEASEGVAIFNDYPGVDDRESIDRNFHTGIKAVDALVPVGVGQSMLIMGKRGTRKTTMALDMVLAAAMAAPSPPSSDREDGEDAPGGFAFVYSCSSREAPRVLRAVEAAGLADRATVVVREDAMSRGRRHVGLLTALAIAEDLRDQGRDAVVFLDDLAPSVRFWEDLCRAEVRMSEEERQELMEVDGMLIARFDALQRQFFSNLLQRSARMSAKLGWGSLTLFGLLQGEPMREDREDLGVKILKHQNLSPEMREKLLMALASRVADAGDGGAEGGGEGEEAVVSTRTVEEFKSISDGHILMCDTNADSSRRGSYDIVSALSTTRLGVGRVAAKEIMALCSSLQVRLFSARDVPLRALWLMICLFLSPNDLNLASTAADDGCPSLWGHGSGEHERAEQDERGGGAASHAGGGAARELGRSQGAAQAGPGAGGGGGRGRVSLRERV